MLYAESTTGERILPVKNGRAICPFCKGEVIAKCGEINYHHWAHKSLKECDDWHEPESEWHLNWKSRFPKANVEVTITKNDKRHRADIVGADGTVIELQHSPISTAKIRERELFYENMIWIFDMNSLGSHSFKRGNDFLNLAGEWEFRFRWFKLRPSLLVAKKPMYFDFGKNMMLRITSLRIIYGYNGTGYFINKDDLISQYEGFYLNDAT